MKNLSNLSPAKGSNTRKIRLGRGIGSGLGKTAGRGHKGQRARKSGNVRFGFEGGQMPLIRHLPKRGFNNPSRIEYNIVNLDVLDRFEVGAKITPKLLEEAGLLRDPSLPTKLLGRGTVKKSFTIALPRVSGSAKSAVEKAGGRIEEI